MGKLLQHLEEIDATVDSYVMYGRAQIIARQPDTLQRWLDRSTERLLINCGMDSGDEEILQRGISKSQSSGSRLKENRKAIKNIKAAGKKAHLHFSLIFGSPGETRASCERSLDFLKFAIAELGPTEQLDVVEADIWWLNFGAPCATIFENYEEALRLAESVGKTISPTDWYEYFGRYADELSVPWEAEKAWYRFFTYITVEQAQKYNEQVRVMMEKVPGAITGREYNFKPPPV